MVCPREGCGQCGGNGCTANYVFIVLILFILLAIIWGGAFY